DSDSGATVTATISFSEAMDQSSTPTISDNAGTTLTSKSKRHNSSHSTYADDDTGADTNVTLADVKFDVSGAKDLAGNTQVAATSVSTGTDVDTQHPTVTPFPYTTLFRSDSDSGATVTATISFSEAMDQSSTPTISDNAGTT